MAQGVGTSVGPIPIGAGQQIIDKIAAQIEFDLSDGSLVGKLQCQDDAAMAQGKQVVFGHRVVRIIQREYAEDLGPGLDKGEYSPPAGFHRFGGVERCLADQARTGIARTTRTGAARG
jgi:hypothetical protein